MVFYNAYTSSRKKYNLLKKLKINTTNQNSNNGKSFESIIILDSVTILFKKNSTIFCWLSVKTLVILVKHTKEVEVEMEEVGFFPHPSEANLKGADTPLLNLIEKSILNTPLKLKVDIGLKNNINIQI